MSSNYDIATCDVTTFHGLGVVLGLILIGGTT
nr:MAG TPA: hypothetical protein [Caudoviricetes sp.]